MNELPQRRRIGKQQKRKQTKKWIAILSFLSILLVIILGIWMVDDDNSFSTRDKKTEPADVTFKRLIQEAKPNHDEDSDPDEKTVDLESNESMDLDKKEEFFQKESLETTDKNVIEAYTGNFNPIGTRQEGNHTPQYDQSSMDWQEMIQAMEVATEFRRRRWLFIG